MEKSEIVPVSPREIKITGVEILERKIFYDERGFLIETFAAAKEKDPSVYSYGSLTHPGWARDEDKFHFHKFQKDRYTVILGVIWILLYDARKESPTYGRLEVVKVDGGSLEVKEKTDVPAFTITIPEGVYHGIKNPGPTAAILVNHPTKEYNAEDEGRILFSEVPILSLDNKNFSWEMVKR